MGRGPHNVGAIMIKQNSEFQAHADLMNRILDHCVYATYLLLHRESNRLIKPALRQYQCVR